jgi:hypothetical protein
VRGGDIAHLEDRDVDAVQLGRQRLLPHQHRVQGRQPRLLGRAERRLDHGHQVEVAHPGMEVAGGQRPARIEGGHRANGANRVGEPDHDARHVPRKIHPRMMPGPPTTHEVTAPGFNRSSHQLGELL